MTGEGQFDDQSLTGKACMGVARAAHAAGVETLGIMGRVQLADDTPLRRLGMTVVELATGLSVEESMAAARELLEERTARLLKPG